MGAPPGKGDSILASQQAEETGARRVEHVSAVMVHLDRPGETAPTGLAFAAVEQERSSWDLVETGELLGHQCAHGHVRRELALVVGERHAIPTLLAIRQGEADPTRAEDRMLVAQVPGALPHRRPLSCNRLEPANAASPPRIQAAGVSRTG
eukprot:558560-Alexandrium_andersonii.AAC.1